MRPPHLHNPPHLPTITPAKRLVGLQNTLVERHGQAARFAIEQPGDFEPDGGRDEGVEGGVGVFEGEGVGVGEVGGEVEEELGGEVQEGGGGGCGVGWGGGCWGWDGHWELGCVSYAFRSERGEMQRSMMDESGVSQGSAVVLCYRLLPVNTTVAGSANRKRHVASQKCDYRVNRDRQHDSRSTEIG